MGGNCSRCTALNRISEEPASLVFLVENEILRKKLLNILESTGRVLVEEEETIRIEVDNFKLFLLELYRTKSLTELEARDIWLVILARQAKLKPSDVKRAQSMEFWLSHIHCADYLDLLEEGRLLVHFQPIVDSSISVIGYECLIRGVDKDGTRIAPGYLFSCAERTDTIFYLDRICRELSIKAASEKNLGEYFIFINFLPTSIYNPETCLRTTMELVEVSGLNPERIVFEVVESHHVEDIKHLKSILDYYRNRGFKIALDDVGSGFSGLVNLVKLQPDIIKIDIEIVRNINGDYLKQGVVQALVDMCRKNDIKVLAEGVENLAEYDFLADKVDFMQGFLFARPSEDPVKSVSIRRV